MGGGDLNTKKSWHPTNRSNQERVWKAEQKKAAEDKRLAELQREIQDERDREDLKNIARSSGFLDDADSANKKLEWMYKGQTLNREEYLMGRSIDKNFEQLAEEEKIKADPINNPAISVPINHVEHEVIPFSIRQYKGLPGTEQVDMARKLMEDPLMLIKQKEMETRRQILQNPVKLKELHKMLKAEKESKKKKSKKEKKSSKKKKHKKSRSGSDESDVDLDKALAEKYQRLQGALSKNLDSDDDLDAGNVDKLLSLKFEALSKELDKMTGSKKKKKKRDSSSSSDDFNVQKKKSREERPQRNVSRSPQRRDNRRQLPEYSRRRSRSPRRSPPRRNFGQGYRSPNRHGDDRRRQSSFSRQTQRNRRSRSRSVDRRRQNRSRTPKKRSRTPENRNRSPPEPKHRNRTPSSSSSSSDSSPEQRNDDSDDDRSAKRTFGLVTADGKGISVKKSVSKRRTSSPTKCTKASTNQEPKKAKPTRMTQEEIDARLKEMMSNAAWREKERTEKVHKYRENEKREQEEANKEFDKDFLTKQLKKTANSTTSVESRIKSNLNNIQRSSRTMESNFARR